MIQCIPYHTLVRPGARMRRAAAMRAQSPAAAPSHTAPATFVIDMAAQLSFLDGISERDRILAAFAENHRTYLEAVRAFAREIVRRDGIVTIDAVRFELERRDFPMPGEVGIDERVFGCVFRSGDFEPVSQCATTRREWAARVGRARSSVTVYRLRESAS